MRYLVLCVGLALGGCGSSGSGGGDLNIRTVTLPDGFTVAAETVVGEAEMERGMMYRTELKPGHGMLFVHGQPGRYPYWMANCKIALDIIWIDAEHKVVEVSAGTPPCPGGGADCPTYGGHAVSLCGLEGGGGWGGGGVGGEVLEGAGAVVPRAKRSLRRIPRRLELWLHARYHDGVKLTIELDREEDGRWIAEALELAGVMCYGQTRDEVVSKTERLAIEVIADRIAHQELPSSALNLSFTVPDEQLARQ